MPCPVPKHFEPTLQGSPAQTHHYGCIGPWNHTWSCDTTTSTCLYMQAQTEHHWHHGGYHPRRNPHCGCHPLLLCQELLLLKILLLLLLLWQEQLLLSL